MHLEDDPEPPVGEARCQVQVPQRPRAVERLRQRRVGQPVELLQRHRDVGSGQRGHVIGDRRSLGRRPRRARPAAAAGTRAAGESAARVRAGWKPSPGAPRPSGEEARRAARRGRSRRRACVRSGSRAAGTSHPVTTDASWRRYSSPTAGISSCRRSVIRWPGFDMRSSCRPQGDADEWELDHEEIRISTMSGEAS